MGDFRARDADRDRAVELLEAAYADGQLGDVDRELRVGRALAAETLDELAGLTRDLQVPAAPAVVAPVPGRAVSSGASGPSPGVIAAVLVGLFVLLVFGTAVMGLVPTGTSSGTGSSTVQAPASQRAGAAPFEMAPARVRQFVRSYEEQFGTLDAFGAELSPSRVVVQVPVGASRPRFERWSYDGGWRRDDAASAVRGSRGTVDLGAIDVRRLFDNIATAPRTLGVRRGELTRVVITPGTDGVAEVTIHVANKSGESGLLTTSGAGDVIRSDPSGS